MQHRNQQKSHLSEITRLLSTYHALTLLQVEALYPELTRQKLLLLLKKLEKGGYIERKTNADDHRSNRVAITDRGNQIIHNSIRFFDEIDRGMFEGFTTEEMEQFRLFLEKAHENLRRMQAGAEHKGTGKEAAE